MSVRVKLKVEAPMRCNYESCETKLYLPPVPLTPQVTLKLCPL
jgi:hypothetical protein